MLIHAAAGVTTICAAEDRLIDPSSIPGRARPRMSARPCVVSRTLRVEMNAPNITAATLRTGCPQRGTTEGGIAAAVVAESSWVRRRRVGEDRRDHRIPGRNLPASGLSGAIQFDWDPLHNL